MKKPIFESKAIPIKLTTELLERIDALARKIGEPRSTIMRFAMKIGLNALEKAYEEAPSDTLRYEIKSGDTYQLNEEKPAPKKKKAP
jgi:predicted DNA-binding protein